MSEELINAINNLETNLKKAVEEQIKITVNGKIDKIKEHLDRQDVYFTDKFTQLDKKIETLRVDATPVIEAGKTVTNSGKFIMWVAGIITSVLVILKLLK